MGKQPVHLITLSSHDKSGNINPSVSNIDISSEDPDGEITKATLEQITEYNATVSEKMRIPENQFEFTYAIKVKEKDPFGSRVTFYSKTVNLKGDVDTQ